MLALDHVRRTPGISCEAVPASDLAGAGMRRHVHSGNHAAESFVSFIPLFGGLVAPAPCPNAPVTGVMSQIGRCP